MISDHVFDNLNTSKRRHSVSAPSTLVSSPQLDNGTQSATNSRSVANTQSASSKCSQSAASSSKCYEGGVTQTDNQIHQECIIR